MSMLSSLKPMHIVHGMKKVTYFAAIIKVADFIGIILDYLDGLRAI